MRTRAAAISLLCLSIGLMAIPATAQYAVKGASNRATGETYHFEVSGDLWNPTPMIAVQSESLGIIGSRIDFVQDLGVEKTRFRQLKVVLRPGKKHKFRFEYTPIKYNQVGTISRDLVFNGIRYPVALPVESTLEWRAYRFGYEWDMVYLDRGFVGLVLEAKYTDVQTTLINAIDTEFVRARAPIPAIGVIGRGYVVQNVSITGEFTAFKLPSSINENYSARYYDFDLYATANFTDHFGAQAGYRSFDVNFKVDKDEGAFTLKGLYFGGVLRY